MTKEDVANIAIIPVIGALSAATGTLLLHQIWITGGIFAVITLGASYLFWMILP